PTLVERVCSQHSGDACAYDCCFAVPLIQRSNQKRIPPTNCDFDCSQRTKNWGSPGESSNVDASKSAELSSHVELICGGICRAFAQKFAQPTLNLKNRRD